MYKKQESFVSNTSIRIGDIRKGICSIIVLVITLICVAFLVLYQPWNNVPPKISPKITIEPNKAQPLKNPVSSYRSLNHNVSFRHDYGHLDDESDFVVWTDDEEYYGDSYDYCQWTPWSSWWDCSKTCGSDGYRRKVRLSQADEDECPSDKMVLKQLCRLERCEKIEIKEEAPDKDCIWAQWSNWTSCSVSCGEGIQSRMRSIKRKASGHGKPCWTQKGETFEKRYCNGADDCLNQRATILPKKKNVYDMANCIWDNVTMSQCSKTCGPGVQVIYETGYRTDNSVIPCEKKITDYCNEQDCVDNIQKSNIPCKNSASYCDLIMPDCTTKRAVELCRKRCGACDP